MSQGDTQFSMKEVLKKVDIYTSTLEGLGYSNTLTKELDSFSTHHLSLPRIA